MPTSKQCRFCFWKLSKTTSIYIKHVVYSPSSFKSFAWCSEFVAIASAFFLQINVCLKENAMISTYRLTYTFSIFQHMKIISYHFLTSFICLPLIILFHISFKNASAFLLRGARHAIAWHTSTAHLCKSTLRFGRRKTIVHRTMCALPEAISDGRLTPPLILICCSPPTEVGVISHLIYILTQNAAFFPKSLN